MFRRIAAALAFCISLALAPAAFAQGGSLSDNYTAEELVNAGGEFFGSVAEGLASVMERAISRYGLPNGYVLGDEAGGALFAGLRYGEGTMYTRNRGDHPVFWQGPSIGFDVGGAGSKVMMLVYNLQSVSDIYGRYPGVDGSAYVVAGLGMTALKYKDVVIVPIRSGLGLRAGVNVGYLKFTETATWNPF